MSFFEGLGSQVELKMEALRAQGSKLGLIRRLLGDILGFILHSNFEDDFWSAKRSARRGPGKRSAAGAGLSGGGGGLASRLYA